MLNLSESDILEICAAFGITREQLPALARYCAQTELDALDEITLERTATNIELPASADRGNTHADADTPETTYATPRETWIVGKSPVIAFDLASYAPNQTLTQLPPVVASGA